MSRFEYAGAFKRHGTLNFMPFGASTVSRMAKISLSTIVGKRWPSRWGGGGTAMRIFPVQYELTPDTRPGATMLQGKPHIGAIVMTRRRTSNFGYQTIKIWEVALECHLSFFSGLHMMKIKSRTRTCSSFSDFSSSGSVFGPSFYPKINHVYATPTKP